MSADGYVDVVAGLAKRAARTEPLERRTNMPVRRHSHAAGRHLVGEAITWDEVARRSSAIGQIARAQPRDPGRRRGCPGTLSIWAEKVYAVLMGYAARHAGQVFPSYADIALHAGCSIRTVARCLRQLKDYGWVRWVRRFEYTGDKGVRGPQVKQISNFYSVTLPDIAKELLQKWKRRRDGKGDAGEQAERARKAAFRDQCEAIERAAEAERKKRDAEAASPAIARAQAKADRESGSRVGAANEGASAGRNANDSRAENPGPERS